MLEVWTLDMSGSAPGDSTDVSGERFRIALLGSLISFPQSFPDDVSHRFTSSLSDGLGESVGFRILDIEAHGLSTILPMKSTYLPG